MQSEDTNVVLRFGSTSLASSFGQKKLLGHQSCPSLCSSDMAQGGVTRDAAGMTRKTRRPKPKPIKRIETQKEWSIWLNMSLMIPNAVHFWSYFTTGVVDLQHSKVAIHHLVAAGSRWDGHCFKEIVHQKQKKRKSVPWVAVQEQLFNISEQSRRATSSKIQQEHPCIFSPCFCFALAPHVEGASHHTSATDASAHCRCTRGRMTCASQSNSGSSLQSPWILANEGPRHQSTTSLLPHYAAKHQHCWVKPPRAVKQERHCS